LNGKYFILEFKRDGKHLEKELDKKQRIKLLEAIKENRKKYESISIKSHLIGYPNFSENKELTYNFEAYIAAIQNKKTAIYRNMNTAKEMIGRLTFDGGSFGSNKEEIKEYIELLQKCAGQNESGSMSGVIFCLDKEKGMSSYSFDNLTTLSKAMHIGIDMTKDLSVGLDKEVDNYIEKSKTIQKRIGKGPSM